MTYRSLQLGIDAIQKGSPAEGARLIRIALKGAELTPQMRAIAYLWLAETQSDSQHKRTCYSEALAVDPGNQEARTRLASLLVAQLPPTPPPAAPAPVTGTTTPHAPAPMPAPTPRPGVNVADHVARVIGGPNGAGTAFFVAPEGLMATTRYVVGNLERVVLEFHSGRQMTGHVLRGHPDLDLALIRVDLRIDSLLPITPLMRVPDDTPLTIVAFDGETVKAQQRSTRRAMGSHWLPTTLLTLPDTGGDLIFDDRNYFVGMMTRNTSRSSNYLFGIHIAAIRRCVEALQTEMRAENRVYCTACGYNSKAAASGMFYCESCGAVMTQARHIQRYPIPHGSAFYDSSRIRCTRCGAMVGYYKGRCLRCGQTPDVQVGT